MKIFNIIFLISSLFYLHFTFAKNLELSNGSPVIYENNKDVARSIIVLNFEGGPVNFSIEEQGVILLLEETLRSGPLGLGKEEFQKKLFNLGIEFDFSHGPNFFEIRVKVPHDKVDDAFSLLKSTISSPRLTPNDFNEYFQTTLASLTSKFEDMRQVIFYFALRDSLTYSPYALSGDTSPESFKKMNFEPFRNKMSDVLDFRKLNLAYVGSLDSKSVVEKFESYFLGGLSKSKYQKLKQLPALTFKKPQKDVVLIDKPGATDNQVAYIFYNDVKRDSLDLLNAKISMDLLGGGLHGELGKTLRTEKGLTYAAMSWLSSSNYPLWMVWTFGGDAQTKGLLTGVTEVLNRFKKMKISRKQIEESKDRLLNEYLVNNELIGDRLLKRIWYSNNLLNFDFHQNFQRNLTTVSEVGVKKFIQQLKIENPLIYIMGDRDKLLKTLSEIGVSQDRVEVISLKDIR